MLTARGQVPTTPSNLGSAVLPPITSAAPFTADFYLYNSEATCTAPASIASNETQPDGDCICICYNYNTGGDGNCYTDFFPMSYPVYSLPGACVSGEVPSGECQCSCQAITQGTCSPSPPPSPPQPPPAPGPAGGQQEAPSTEHACAVCLCQQVGCEEAASLSTWLYSIGVSLLKVYTGSLLSA